jgi:hypothetical protein
MNLSGAARLYACDAFWRATGSRAAGRALLNALGSGDEDLQTLAGTFLARGGRKAEPLLEEALAKREHLPLVLTLLGDIADPKYDDTFRRFSNDPEPRVATAARSALRLLNARTKRC